MDDDTATRQAVLDLASIVLEQEAPEELAALDEASTAYFDDPRRALAALTPDQAREVRRIAYERALALGVKDPRAGVHADAVVGGLVVA